jgi:pimeloyl-ACP methyl ester carboxylesterase
MPYVNNNGVKIYYEVEGEGLPLVLAYALMGSINGWRRNGYVDALKTDYKLVLFDTRGRGHTDRPHEASAYGYNLLASDVLSILDDLGITKAHYFGYSMGARVGFLLAAHNAGRFYSFIFGGNTPYGISEVATKIMREYIEEYKLLRSNPESYIQLMERRLGHSLTAEERQRYLAQDAETLIAMQAAWLDSPSLTDQDLSSITLPCLVFCGDRDQGEFHQAAKECVNHIPNARFVSLPGCDHGTAITRSDLILPHIKEFLAGVGKK